MVQFFIRSLRQCLKSKYYQFRDIWNQVILVILLNPFSYEIWYLGRRMFLPSFVQSDIIYILYRDEIAMIMKNCQNVDE